MCMLLLLVICSSKVLIIAMELCICLSHKINKLGNVGFILVTVRTLLK